MLRPQGQKPRDVPDLQITDAKTQAIDSSLSTKNYFPLKYSSAILQNR